MRINEKNTHLYINKTKRQKADSENNSLLEKKDVNATILQS